MQITIDNLDIEYDIFGDDDAPPILMLHGWGSSFQAFRPIIDSLKNSYKVVGFNLPGCGASSEMETPWTVKEYADLTQKFMNKLDLKDPILIGHSHGGRIAMYMAANGMTSPKKMVLLGSAGIKAKKSFESRVKIRTFKLVKGFLSCPIWRKSAAKTLDKARNYFGSADYKSASPVLRQTLVNLVNSDIREILPKIGASVLLIYGEKDTATPVSAAKIIESKIKDCGLCIIKDAGHFAFLDSPHEVNAIINSFLGVK